MSVLRRSHKVILEKVIVTVVEVLQVSFITNILKPTFHNCRGDGMLVVSQFRTGKVRYSHSYRRGVRIGVAAAC